MADLRALDEIAYIRFASVYRDFKTLEDLRAAWTESASGVWLAMSGA